MSYNSSEPEALDLGFTLPKGTDLIRNGDDAITANARVATGAIRHAFNRITALEQAPAPVADHGGLTGLTDDDHPQYLTNARADGRYSPLGHTHPPTSWTEVTDKPTAFPPSAHVHTPAEVGSVPADDPRLRDTGWRSLELLNGWVGNGSSASSNPAVRRVGRTVFIRVRNLNGANAANHNVATLPHGFLPPSADGGLIMLGGTVRHLQVNTLGSVQVLSGNGTAGNGSAMSISYLTEHEWPSTLPGTPA